MDFTLTATDVRIAAQAHVATLADAQAAAALFPKAAKVKATTSTGPVDGDYRNGTTTRGLVTFTANLAADDVNKGHNEAGVRRYRSFRRTAERLGHSVTYSRPYTNSLTAEQLAALLWVPTNQTADSLGMETSR
jgi:hypothetical protein